MPPSDPKDELTRESLASAQEDLALAQLALAATPPLLAGATYHCQQAFEKALKGFLTYHDQAFRKTHDLADLVMLCQAVDPSFQRLAYDASLVNPYATAFRYPPVVSPLTLPTASAALQMAQDAMQFVLAALPDAIRP
ncbi:MAG: HEPN domain-containing protein [Chloroflexi bacterium]|nr:HEPN domain-containing protein [Chloroflexota bacterium]